jgi:flagellar biosynthesis/type III secretory pathway chaperone
MLNHSNTVANCLEDSAIEELFASLIDILGRELVIYQELKDFLTVERSALMNSGLLDELNENNSHKENIILKSRILEEVRSNVLKKIARHLDMDERRIKLSALVEYADHEKAESIEKLKRALMTMTRDIALMNDENRYLLNTSINNIKGSLNFMSSLMNRSGIYLGNGAIGENRNSGRLLHAEG